MLHIVFLISSSELLGLRENWALMNGIHVVEPSLFYIVTQKISVVFLEGLTDPSLIAHYLIAYVKHIDGV